MSNDIPTPPRNANLPIGERQIETVQATQESGDPNRQSVDPGGRPGPGISQGWHSRGYLPHYDSNKATQHVTFHLADSLPKEVLERLEQELRTVPEVRRDSERRKRVEAWIDAGHGSCVLREPEIARMVEDAFLFFDEQRYVLLAWVVMPNHVHVLFRPVNDWPLAKIVASWKKFTARRICDHLRNANLPIGERQIEIAKATQESGGPNPKIGDKQKSETEANQKIGDVKIEVTEATQESGGPIRKSGGPGPIWHREYWDRFIRDERDFQRVVEYIHLNPVKAGLTANAEDWPWSSARFGTCGSTFANREIGVPNRQI